MGMFTPGTPFASDAGMAVLNGKRDLAAAKALIAESGYKGEKIVLMAPEIPESHAMADVANALHGSTKRRRTNIPEGRRMSKPFTTSGKANDSAR